VFSGHGFELGGAARPGQQVVELGVGMPDDDGNYLGGTMERRGLVKLLSDVRAWGMQRLLSSVNAPPEPQMTTAGG